MKLTKILAVVMAVAALATSCKKPVEPTPEAKTISVAAQMYNFTRATDTAFEEGDAIGLHILNGATWLDNAKYTYTGGKLVGEQTNLWYTDEEVEADVLAYYPYNANAAYNAAGYTFTVNADQSSAALYTASDFMLATTNSKPTASAVELPFRHTLSKVVVKINNQLGEDIANVWFSDVYGTTTINLMDGKSVASGSKGTIKAANVTIDGAQAWALIVVPQENVKPQLMVTTASKKQYTFELQDAVTFSAGKVSTAEVALTKESIATSFTPTISDWEADNDLQFNQTENGDNGDEPELPFEAKESGLGVVGSFGNSNWATDEILYTTPTEGLLVAANIDFDAYEAFKIRTVGTWEGDVNLGRGEVNYIKANKYITATVGGSDITIEASGTYDIYFDQNTKVVYVMAAGANIAEATEQTENGEEPVIEEPDVTGNLLYLAPNTNWKADGARFAAYFWKEGGEAWVNMADTDADGIYEVNIPVGYAGGDNIIFCRMDPSKTTNGWGNKWNQTGDLVIPTDGTNLYTVPEDTWDKGAGSWSTK